MRMRGLTLVELQVALALGLLVTLLAGSLLLAANKGFVAQSEGAQLDEAGRFAVAIVARAVRQAGFANWDAASAHASDLPAQLAGLDARSLKHSKPGIEDPEPDVANGSDVLAVRFAADGIGTNCAGFTPDDGEEGWSIFYVARAADGETELRCKYRGERGWGSDALVRGVDSFQVRYGLDTDMPADGVANEFVTAARIKALDDALVLEGADAAARARDLRRKTYWKRVASVEVAILLHGAPRSRPDGGLLGYELFGQAYSSAQPGDQGTRIDEHALPLSLQSRARQLFGATIAVRNRAL
ncbi:MAG: PilW family protein [Pseudomonadota bacterium]